MSWAWPSRGWRAALTMVALDGKVLKGAWEELRDVKVKLLSALVHGEGVIAGTDPLFLPWPGVRREPPRGRGLLQADADRRGPTLFLVDGWVSDRQSGS